MARRPVTSTKLTQAVADHLRTLIHRGEVGPAERLPPERELAEQLGVARISLREAIKQLRDEGYDRDAALYFILDAINDVLDRWGSTRRLDSYPEAEPEDGVAPPPVRSLGA